MYKYIWIFIMNILLTKKEQDLLFLLEELTKNHDWIEIPVLAENLKLPVKELQEHLSRLEQLFPNLLIQSRKKASNYSLTSKIPWILGLQSLNNLQPTLFWTVCFSKRDNHLTKCARRFRLIQSRLRKSFIVLTHSFPNTTISLSNLPLWSWRE